MLKNIKKYILGTYHELFKVTYLTRTQLIRHTIVVFIVVVFFALFMLAFDIGFKWTYSQLIS